MCACEGNSNGIIKTGRVTMTIIATQYSILYPPFHHSHSQQILLLYAMNVQPQSVPTNSTPYHASTNTSPAQYPHSSLHTAAGHLLNLLPANYMTLCNLVFSPTSWLLYGSVIKSCPISSFQFACCSRSPLLPAI